MKLTVVRYRTKPEAAGDNERLIQTVFQDLTGFEPAKRHPISRIEAR